MDINTIRNAVTVVSLILFVGLMVWTWRPQRRGAHEEASQLVFADESSSRESPGHE